MSLLYPKIDPLMGVMPGLKAFVAAVLGGIGNITGAMLGGLILGMAEVMAVGYGESTYRDAIATLCGVDEAIGASTDIDVLELAERRHDYLQAHVKHPDGIYFYTLFRTQGPKEQAAGLKNEAADVKLTSNGQALVLEEGVPMRNVRAFKLEAPRATVSAARAEVTMLGGTLTVRPMLP